MVNITFKLTNFLYCEYLNLSLFLELHAKWHYNIAKSGMRQNFHLSVICKNKLLRGYVFSFQERLSLGALPHSRFILVTMGILMSVHQSNMVSLLLNSGILGLTQTLMRLVGKSSFNLFSYKWSILIMIKKNYLRIYQN